MASSPEGSVKKPAVFTSQQVAEIIGVGPHWVKVRLDDGDIPSFRPSPRSPRVVERTVLVSYCIKMGIPFSSLRRAINAGRDILCVGCAPLGVGISLAGCHVHHAPTMFDAGLELGENDAFWAAVVNLQEIGRTEAIGGVARLSRVVDRPFLVGLTAEDEPVTAPVRAADVFDVVFPAWVELDEIDAMLRRLSVCDL